MSRIVAIGLGAVLLTGACASGSSLLTKSAAIERGAAKHTVLEVLGSPDDRQFRGDDEAWQYCRTGYFGADQYVIVWFHQGRVTGMTTYRNTKSGPCSSFFRTIRWEDSRSNH